MGHPQYWMGHPLSGMRDRVRDYIAMGVTEVWLLDPETRTAILCDGTTVVEQTMGDLTVPRTHISVSLGDIFSVLQ